MNNIIHINELNKVRDILELKGLYKVSELTFLQREKGIRTYGNQICIESGSLLLLLGMDNNSIKFLSTKLGILWYSDSYNPFVHTTQKQYKPALSLIKMS